MGGFARDIRSYFRDFCRLLESVKNFYEGMRVIVRQNCASYPNLRSHRAVIVYSVVVWWEYLRGTDLTLGIFVDR